MAQDDLTSVPPDVPPPGIRRYLGFTKLSSAAVQAVARLLDRDATFRAHVAAAVDERAVGRAAWLWLNRPEGWRDEFAELEAEAAASAATASDEREERDARRRLTAARAAAERATATATARAQEAAGIRADLTHEQAHRRQLEKRLARLETQLQQARDERTTAVRQLKQVEAKLARRATEAKEATARLRDLEHQRALPGRSDEAPATKLDAAVVGEALATVTAQVTELAQTLRDLHELILAAASDTTDAELDGSDPVPGAEQPGALTDGPAERRLPLALPGGIRDDSAEAVDFLLRAPGAWLLVDGYNVSMVGWPEFSVAEQRRRLVIALCETAARSGASVKVVFDGATTESWPLPQPARHLVSVMFSPAGVEADDVLLDLVARLPPARPLIVASSDNRVRDGARRLGANLVHARQLLGVLRP
ncbi:MAG: NYN domain-containing protein [Acidimicrobiales bacterium]